MDGSPDMAASSWLACEKKTLVHEQKSLLESESWQASICAASVAWAKATALPGLHTSLLIVTVKTGRLLGTDAYRPL